MKLAVVGAGLSGLVTAHTCARAGISVTLFEASGRAGGQLHTERERGFVVELGAEGFVASSEAVPALARSLGIESELIDQSVNRSYGFDGNGLQELAPGEAARFLGFQVKSDELGRGVRSFRDGMQTLSRALVERLPPSSELRLGVEIVALQRATNGVALTLAGGSSADFDGVVLATNARHVSALLGSAFASLAESKTLSNVSVSLAYELSAFPRSLDASGFVVALNAQREGLRACSFASSKFEHRAPPGYALLRAFFRPSDDDLDGLADAGWVARAESGLERILGTQAPPRGAWVSRWKQALPISDSPHTERVARLEAALAGSPIWLAGSAFHGSGIDAAVRSAEKTARSVLSALA